MCGRYSLTSELDRLLPRLRGALPAGLRQHYAPRPQIRPGEPLLLLRQEHGQLGAALALWGLLPSWVKDPGGCRRPINARAETVAEKASFRGPWRHHRCLIPADAFQEKGHQVRRADGAPFWLGGLWERWIGADGSELDTCCVLTTTPNDLIAPVHHRMPVVVPDGLEEPWLAPCDGPALRALEPLLQPWDGSAWRLEPLPKPAPQCAPLDQDQLELPW
ncbi:SOS response-associated peptidase [Cyanobium sp. LEGE 06113]|uniref:SOS response-associated peptidase n=1 Tax=Cyanobium sp. LEGE 06113 TaxID=1297573 RepID=UPI001880FEDD|nr:SOS response-associated peptidase [Cyanobium sp. LEGE 06113]MBE9155006.1 SOS response-associated peptidase [Cyanobium sp. LEGE 06113]